MEEEKTSKSQKVEQMLVLVAIALIGVAIVSLLVLAAVGLHHSVHYRPRRIYGELNECY